MRHFPDRAVEGRLSRPTLHVIRRDRIEHAGRLSFRPRCEEKISLDKAKATASLKWSVFIARTDNREALSKRREERRGEVCVCGYGIRYIEEIKWSADDAA